MKNRLVIRSKQRYILAYSKDSHSIFPDGFYYGEILLDTNPNALIGTSRRMLHFDIAHTLGLEGIL